MTVAELINYLQKVDPKTEVCTCDINGDVEAISGLANREKEAYLVREAKPWNQGEDYYEYWTLNPNSKETLDQKKVFLLW